MVTVATDANSGPSTATPLHFAWLHIGNTTSLNAATGNKLGGVNQLV